MRERTPRRRLFFVWSGLLLSLAGLSHCLSHRDLSGFPCPQDRACPAPLVCHAGTCIAPGQGPEQTTQEPKPSDGAEPSRPEPPRERSSESPKTPDEVTPEPPPEVRPELPPESPREAPASITTLQEDVLFKPELRWLRGLTAAPGEQRLLIAGYKDAPPKHSGVLLKGPDYKASYDWSSAYASRKPLYDVAWVGGSVYVAVGNSRQSGETAEYGPMIRSRRNAFASMWDRVTLGIPEADKETATLYRLAVDTPGTSAKIVAVGTTDRDGKGKGIILTSDDQGATWKQASFDVAPTTVLRDVAFRPNSAERHAFVVGNNSGIFEGTASSGTLQWSAFARPSAAGDYLAIAIVPPSDLVLSIKDPQSGHQLHYYDATRKEWSAAQHPTLPAQINGLYTAPSGLVVAMGDNGQLLQSTDRGRSWSTIATNTRHALHRALFHNGRLYITGDNILFSTELP